MKMKQLKKGVAKQPPTVPAPPGPMMRDNTKPPSKQAANAVSLRRDIGTLAPFFPKQVP